MTATDPAAELRAAASMLRDAADKAVHNGRDTWMQAAAKGSRSPVVVDDADEPTVLIETFAERLEAVNAFLTMVGPRVGRAIAEWLADAADGDNEGEINPHALATARAINGEG